MQYIDRNGYSEREVVEDGYRDMHIRWFVEIFERGGIDGVYMEY